MAYKAGYDLARLSLGPHFLPPSQSRFPSSSASLPVTLPQSLCTLFLLFREPQGCFLMICTQIAPPQRSLAHLSYPKWPTPITVNNNHPIDFPQSAHHKQYLVLLFSCSWPASPVRRSASQCKDLACLVHRYISSTDAQHVAAINKYLLNE